MPSFDYCASCGAACLEMYLDDGEFKQYFGIDKENFCAPTSQRLIDPYATIVIVALPPQRFCSSPL